jgi:dienelactone hydrolase
MGLLPGSAFVIGPLREQHQTRPMLRGLVFGIAGIGGLLLGASALSELHGLSFVLRAAGLRGVVRFVADVDTVRYTERSVHVPLQSGPVEARIYAPLRRSRQTVLLVSGLHAAGIDEPRLVEFGRELAKSGVTVVTPAIRELSRFEITPRLTDHIEQAALWVAGNPVLSPAGRIGLMGISFSGGPSIVAAGRESLRNRVLYVLAFGGHDDLPRVLQYLCTRIEPEAASAPWMEPEDGPTRPPPHDYGVAVVFLNVADHLVPAAQVEPLRDGVRRYLKASYLDRSDKAGSAREFAAVRILAAQLPEPAATLLQNVNDRNVAWLGPVLLPYVESHGNAPGLSPSRSPAPNAPVFLLHGRHDTVIPAVESEYLARRLRGHVPVRLLITDLVSHAEADQPPDAIDVLRLASFWGDVLSR